MSFDSLMLQSIFHVEFGDDFVFVFNHVDLGCCKLQLPK